MGHYVIGKTEPVSFKLQEGVKTENGWSYPVAKMHKGKTPLRK